MAITQTQLSDFSSLFFGNPRSFGQWDPKTREMFTKKAPYTGDHVLAHLRGEVGLGLVPILDDSTCMFGVIDIDCHNPEDPRTDLVVLEEKVREHDLPLVVCRSKSGGAHCYVFCAQPIEAVEVIKALKRWAALVGFPKAEIFPKQAKLPVVTGGERPLGNWINLPYFNAEGDTDRFAIEGGKIANFGLFLETALSRRVLPPQLRALSNVPTPVNFAEAPPCVQAMNEQGVSGAGFRNVALYNAVVFLKKRDPDHFFEAAREFNTSVFDKPLPDAEATKCIKSASRRDYMYKCNEEPSLSLCDRDACKMRKFGIGKGAKDMPMFSGLKMYKTDPVSWELSIDHTPVVISTDQLMKYSLLRRAIIEATQTVPPRIKDADWDFTLSDLMKDVVSVEVPSEASVAGMIADRMRDFIGKSIGSLTGEFGDRADLLRGLPVLTEVVENEKDGDGLDASVKIRVVAFRAKDFVDHLKRTRSEDLRGPNLWMALRDIGVTHRRIRIGVGTKITNVWCVPVDSADVKLPEKEFGLEY